jgi:hypothetical protein
MGVTYTQGSEVATLVPSELAGRLEGAVMAGMRWLGKVTEEAASRPERSGPDQKAKWSAKQVIGHLTDSAVNNLGRVVRMQIASGLTFPGYEQEEWVAVQHYAERDWSQVLAVWTMLNGQMAWVIAHADAAKLAHVAEVEGDTLTLGFLMEDYIAHMEHHLRLMKAWLAG